MQTHVRPRSPDACIMSPLHARQSGMHVHFCIDMFVATWHSGWPYLFVDLTLTLQTAPVLAARQLGNQQHVLAAQTKRSAPQRRKALTQIC